MNVCEIYEKTFGFQNVLNFHIGDHRLTLVSSLSGNIQIHLYRKNNINIKNSILIFYINKK